MKIVLFVGVIFGLIHISFGLRCHSCEGISCSRTTVSKSEECADNLSVCMTINTKNSGIFAKGCDETLSEGTRNMCNNKDVECLSCNTDLCNNVGSFKFQCIQCNSDKDQNCKTSANSITPEQCPTPLASHSFCYAQQHQNGTVQRGCSLTTKQQNDCFDNAKCRICAPDELPGCNDIVFDSTGTGTPAPPITTTSTTTTTTTTTTQSPPQPPTTTTTSKVTTPTTTTSTLDPPGTTTTKKPGSATSIKLSFGVVIVFLAHIVLK